MSNLGIFGLESLYEVVVKVRLGGSAFQEQLDLVTANNCESKAIQIDLMSPGIGELWSSSVAWVFMGTREVEDF